MAKGGKKSSAKKATAKQLPSLPVPPEMARWASEVARWLGQWKRDNEDYWAKNPPADWTDPSIWRFLAERDLRPRARAEEVAPKKQESIPKDPKNWLARVRTRFPTGEMEKREDYFKRVAGHMRRELGDNAWEASTIGARMYEGRLLPLRQKRAKKPHRKSH